MQFKPVYFRMEQEKTRKKKMQTSLKRIQNIPNQP